MKKAKISQVIGISIYKTGHHIQKCENFEKIMYSFIPNSIIFRQKNIGEIQTNFNCVDVFKISISKSKN